MFEAIFYAFFSIPIKKSQRHPLYYIYNLALIKSRADFAQTSQLSFFSKASRLVCNNL